MKHRRKTRKRNEFIVNLNDRTSDISTEKWQNEYWKINIGHARLLASHFLCWFDYEKWSCSNWLHTFTRSKDTVLFVLFVVFRVFVAVVVVSVRFFFISVIEVEVSVSHGRQWPGNYFITFDKCLFRLCVVIIIKCFGLSSVSSRPTIHKAL